MLAELVGPIARRRPIVAFVALAYGLSWGVWILGYLALPADAPYFPLVVLGVFGPAVAAMTVIRASGRRVRTWLADVLEWRVAPRWYLAALLLPVVMYAVAAVALVAAGASVRLERAGWGALLFVAGLPAATLLTGGNEEFGWRGFLLPRLQRRYSALVASLVVGVVWAGWHLPVYLLPLGLTNGPFRLFLPFAVLASVAFTWIYNSTNGSVLVSMLLHGSLNSAVGLVGGVLALDPVNEVAPWRARILGALLVAVTIVLVYGYAALSVRGVTTVEPPERTLQETRTSRDV